VFVFRDLNSCCGFLSVASGTGVLPDECRPFTRNNHQHNQERAMRQRVSESLSRANLSFRPHLEQLTSRLVPAALADFAAGPLAAFDPSEADVVIVADETTKAEAGEEVIEVIFTDEGQTEAGPELPTEIDLTNEGAYEYLTCFPVGEDYAAGDEELLYFTCGFGEEEVPANERTDDYELIFTTTVVEGEGGEEVPVEGESLPDDSDILVDPMPGGEPSDEVVYWGDTENPEIYYMMGGPMTPPAAEAAPTTPAAPNAGNQSDIVSALSPTTPSVGPTQANANAVPQFSVLPATPVASAASIAKSAYSTSGIGGGAGSEQDSSSAFHAEGGTQAALPESEPLEEVSAAPVELSGDEQSAAPVSAVEEAALPTAASAVVPDVETAPSEAGADVVLRTSVVPENAVDQDAQLPGAAWSLTAAAAVLTLTDRQRRPVKLAGR
jgi:hypothetical protein